MSLSGWKLIDTPSGKIRINDKVQHGLFLNFHLLQFLLEVVSLGIIDDLGWDKLINYTVIK